MRDDRFSDFGQNQSFVLILKTIQTGCFSSMEGFEEKLLPALPKIAKIDPN